MKQNRMFHIVTKTWNPITGCYHQCIYCWARKLAEKLRRRGVQKYKHGFKPTFHKNELYKARYFSHNDFVFVSDMGDMWGDWVHPRWIIRVLEAIRESKATFLFLTKNPKRYHQFLNLTPDNCFLGATIETNRDMMYFRHRISKAPLPSVRYKAMKELEWEKKFLSIEPILDFDLDVFTKWITEINPKIIYIGYDNYNHKLPEPPLNKTQKLIKELTELGFTVYEKTLRKAWYENKH